MKMIYRKQLRPIFPQRPMPVSAPPQEKTSFTFKLTDEQQILLADILAKGNYRPIQMPYTIAAAETDDCKIALYTSGKCLVQGKAAKDFVAFVLEPKILGTVGLGYEELLQAAQFEPHIGVDESGKGDFFGPLAIAAAYTDAALAKAMMKMGVKDSKNITSDKKALELGREIRKMLGKKFSLVVIGPRAYNRLYEKMRNVNLVLAWGHARAIENLLEEAPDCPRALSDQFGNKALIEKALMGKGRKIVLDQRHRAESDIAVAAASILARTAFLDGLRKLRELHHQDFPKGASQQVIAAAQRIVQTKGPELLFETAKYHFKTTDVVLESCGFKRQKAPSDGATARADA